MNKNYDEYFNEAKKLYIPKHKREREEYIAERRAEIHDNFWETLYNTFKSIDKDPQTIDGGLPKKEDHFIEDGKYDSKIIFVIYDKKEFDKAPEDIEFEGGDMELKEKKEVDNAPLPKFYELKYEISIED